MEENIEAIYDQLHESHPGTVFGTGWASRENALACYKAVVEAPLIVPVDGPVRMDEWTVLDVGCGYGHLYEAWDHAWGLPADHYTGVDLNPDYLAIARSRNPGATFWHNDVRKIVGKWNCVAMVGTLSWYSHQTLWQIVRAGLSLAEQVLVIVQNKDTTDLPTTEEIELRTDCKEVISVTLETGMHTAYYIFPGENTDDDPDTNV